MHHFLSPFVTLLTQLVLFSAVLLPGEITTFYLYAFCTRPADCLHFNYANSQHETRQRKKNYPYRFHLVGILSKRKCFTFGVNSSILALFMRNFGISFESYFIMNMFIVFVVRLLALRLFVCLALCVLGFDLLFSPGKTNPCSKSEYFCSFFVVVCALSCVVIVAFVGVGLGKQSKIMREYVIWVFSTSLKSFVCCFLYFRYLLYPALWFCCVFFFRSLVFALYVVPEGKTVTIE